METPEHTKLLLANRALAEAKKEIEALRKEREAAEGMCLLLQNLYIQDSCDGICAPCGKCQGCKRNQYIAAYERAMKG